MPDLDPAADTLDAALAGLRALAGLCRYADEHSPTRRLADATLAVALALAARVGRLERASQAPDGGR